MNTLANNLAESKSPTFQSWQHIRSKLLTLPHGWQVAFATKLGVTRSAVGHMMKRGTCPRYDQVVSALLFLLDNNVSV